MESFDLSWDLLRRVAKKPPRVVLHRAWQMALARWRRRTATSVPHTWRIERLLSWSKCEDVPAFWAQILAAPWPGQDAASAILKECPAELPRILEAAERAHRGEVNLLGSSPQILGARIPWHTDYKTGFTWNPGYCHDISYADLGKPNDVKIPWEVSRFQWALPLAQAWALTQDPRHAERFISLMEDWIEQNPYAMSVNWACAMDVALRAMAWIWGVMLIRDAPCWTVERKSKVLSALYGHGHFILRNLEVSDVNGNHYLSDAAGLVFLGAFFQGIGEGDRWLGKGRKILEEELFLQVYPDGVDHEASIPYHRLVLELFLAPFLVLESRGVEIAIAARERIRRMASFVADYSGPDGQCPRFGDADDGRALAFGGQPVGNHRYLCHVAGAWLNDGALLQAAGQAWPEALWWCGSKATVEPWPNSDLRPSILYPDGGIAILRTSRTHLVVEAGPLGLRGRGGHGHNDATSFELWVDGERLVSDRGAWVYTADVAGRNEFRATASHSLLQVGEEELNRFVDPLNLWQLHDDARPRIQVFAPTPEGGRIVAEHQGYARMGLSISRTWELDHSGLAVCDTLSGDPNGSPLTVRLWLAEGIQAELDGIDLSLITPIGRRHSLSWEDTRWKAKILERDLSPSYGVRCPSLCIEWHLAQPKVDEDFRLQFEWAQC